MVVLGHSIETSGKYTNAAGAIAVTRAGPWRVILTSAPSVKGIDNVTVEAHSTDYQPAAALTELASHHFFFLKVGPELTFRIRD